MYKRSANENDHSSRYLFFKRKKISSYIPPVVKNNLQLPNFESINYISMNYEGMNYNTKISGNIWKQNDIIWQIL